MKKKKNYSEIKKLSTLIRSKIQIEGKFEFEETSRTHDVRWNRLDATAERPRFFTLRMEEETRDGNSRYFAFDIAHNPLAPLFFLVPDGSQT